MAMNNQPIDRIAYGASRPSNGGNLGDTTCRVGTLTEQPSGHRRVAVVILKLRRKTSERFLGGTDTLSAFTTLRAQKDLY